MLDQKFQKFIEELKNRNEITEVVSQYCQLERKGGSYWSCCPLPGHMEKTPSFCVNQAGQFFKCFGCQRGGDVIKFIMEVENLPYMEAVKLLADRANMQMPETSFKEQQNLEENAKIRATRLQILKDTARFYVDNLSKPEAEPYLTYIFNRGLTEATIRAFGIGCSLNYHDLPKYLHEKGHKYEDMLTAGVVTYNKDTDQYTDFEAKRMIVPIIDNFSNVLAFGGRVIEKNPDFAKYKNTRETSVFIKNRTVFNINNIKKLKREMGTIPYLILVEGYMDVIALHASGIKNAVASMGTSLTVEQARILLRYSDTVIVSYDGDAAGQKATFRGMQILKDAGLTVKVISLPDNLDPDEYIKARGVDNYKQLLLSAEPLIDYKLHYLAKTYDLNDVTQKRKFIDKALEVIAQSDKAFEREELLKKLSQLSKISYEALDRDLNKSPNKSANKPVNSQIPKNEEENLGVEAALVKAERFILFAIINKEKYTKISDIDQMGFSSQTREDIASKIILLEQQNLPYDTKNLSQELGEDYYPELNSIFEQGEEVLCQDGYEKYYSDCKKYIERKNLKNEISDLQEYCKAEDDITKQLQIVKIIHQKLSLLFNNVEDVD